MKILVAEDESVIAKHICRQLEKSGYTTRCANNGNEAIHALSNEFFDIVLMDVEMPEMNGLDATRAIRKSDDIYATVPIIGVSANEAPPVDEQCFKAGMNHFISKPFSLDLFEQALLTAKSRDTLKGSSRGGADA